MGLAGTRQGAGAQQARQQGAPGRQRSRRPAPRSAASASGWPAAQASRNAHSARPIGRQTTPSAGRVSRAPSPCQSSSRRRVRAACAVARPDGVDRLRRRTSASARPGAARAPARRAASGGSAASRAGSSGGGVGGAVGLGPAAVEPGDAGQVAAVRAPARSREEVGEAGAVVQQPRRRAAAPSRRARRRRRGTTRCRPGAPRPGSWPPARRCRRSSRCCGRRRRPAGARRADGRGRRTSAARTAPARSRASKRASRCAHAAACVRLRDSAQRHVGRARSAISSSKAAGCASRSISVGRAPCALDEALDTGARPPARRRVVRVDQQRAPSAGSRAVAGEMDLADRVGRKAVEPGGGVEAEVVRRDVDVVDVEQQAAAGAPGELGEEVDLVPVVPVDAQVVRRVLDRDAAARARPACAPMLARDALQRRGRAREGQQVGKVAPVHARPGQVLGDQRRLDAPHQRGEARQMLRRRAARRRRATARRRAATPDGAARIASSQPQPRPAVDHVVLGMDLEPQARRVGRRSAAS